MIERRRRMRKWVVISLIVVVILIIILGVFAWYVFVGPDYSNLYESGGRVLENPVSGLTMEEAIERSKEIIVGIESKGTDPPIKYLVDPKPIQLKEAEKAIKKEEKLLNELKYELEQLKKQVMGHQQEHKEDKEQIEQVDQEIIDTEHDLGVVEENLDLAEEVQEEKKD